MHPDGFDGLARALSGAPRRRDLLAAALVVATGFGGGRIVRGALAGSPAAAAPGADANADATPAADPAATPTTEPTATATPAADPGETATADPSATPELPAEPTPSPTPAPLPLPRIAVDPATITVGAPLGVEAYVAAPTTRARLRWDGVTLQSGLATTPAGDAHLLLTTVTVPKTPAGEHTLTLDAAGVRIEARVTVVPALAVATTAPKPGSRLRVTITGMPANSRIELQLLGAVSSVRVGTLSTDATGSATATIAIPTTPPPGATRLEARPTGGGPVAAVALDIPCAASQIRCDGACRDALRDREHCGACGTVCPGGCANGVCLAGDDREIDAFVKRWKGKGIDFDGVYGYQCMDLYQQYNLEVWGEPQVPAGYAMWVWTKDLYPRQRYVKIPRENGAIPRKGDVVLWKSANGAGHVAICVSATTSGFTSLDQNWPVGGLPQLIKHDYKDVLGWLRPV